MNNSFLDRNLASLKKKDPALFDKISPLKGSNSYAVTQSRSGLPSLIHVDEAGNKKQIESNYDPASDASRYFRGREIDNSINFIVMGLGLGYQAFEIIRNVSRQAKIYIFEKDPELFALAIREIDFTLIFEHPGVRLFVDIDPRDLANLVEPERINFTLNEYCLVKQKALIDRNINYFEFLFEQIENYFNESRVDLKTQTIHSKLYYKNIFSNLISLQNSPGIDSLKGRLSGIPSIICSAGPSLDKNIQLLNSARENFFLIAVGTALKPLLYNGIHPDVVLSIDPDEQTISAFDFAKGMGNTCLVYNAAVPSVIPKAFPGKRVAFDLDVCLAEWFKRHSGGKGGLGKISSVAHSALNFANYLACSPVILVGQDLSFHRQRQHCLHSFYYDESMYLVSRYDPLYYLNRLKYLNYGQNLVKCIDIFACQVNSTLAMDSYNHIFSKTINTTQTVINATEGGVPIKGVENLSLKEALYKYCNNPVSESCDSLMESIPLRKSSQGLFRDSTLNLIRYLNDISEKVDAVKLKHQTSTDPDSMQLFVDDMEVLYKDILEYKEVALLLQGYDFSGFSEWYRSNSQILNKVELSKDSSLLGEKYDRDKKFLLVLADSVEYLRVNFEKSLSLYEN